MGHWFDSWMFFLQPQKEQKTWKTQRPVQNKINFLICWCFTRPQPTQNQGEGFSLPYNAGSPSNLSTLGSCCSCWKKTGIFLGQIRRACLGCQVKMTQPLATPLAFCLLEGVSRQLRCRRCPVHIQGINPRWRTTCCAKAPSDTTLVSRAEGCEREQEA